MRPDRADGVSDQREHIDLAVVVAVDLVEAAAQLHVVLRNRDSSNNSAAAARG
jgi:hypothetical protein